MGNRYTLFDSTKTIVKDNIVYMYIMQDLNYYSNTTFISIIDQDSNYIEYEIKINKSSITYNVAARLRSLFNDFQFTRQTEVVVDEKYDTKSPIYLYLMFIKQQIQFNLRSTSLDIIIRRIAFRHQSYLKTPLNKVNKSYLNKMWLKLLDKEKCPWISEEIHYQIQNLSENKQKIKKILRLAMYYLVAKNQILAWNKNSLKNNIH